MTLTAPLPVGAELGRGQEQKKPHRMAKKTIHYMVPLTDSGTRPDPSPPAQSGSAGPSFSL